MRRVFRFLVVLTLCWALIPAAVAHAQDESDDPPDVSDDCVVDLEALWEDYQNSPPGTEPPPLTEDLLPAGCTTVWFKLPETYYIPDDGGSITLPDGTTVTPDADGRVTLPDGTTGTIVAPIPPKSLIVEEVADGKTVTIAPPTPTRPTTLIIDGVPYSL